MIYKPNKTVPPVSILIPTYNRRAYLPMAVESALSQEYANFQVILVRDGGEDISDIVQQFDDPRLIFINRSQNKGKAYSLNEALHKASGKYICYLDDDDQYYPNHIRSLVSVLEDGEKYQVAYSDLYKAHCRIEADGSRTILSKNVEITRDFDRMLMLNFNIALHVSLMHRKDLIDLTGLYNESLNILIDWDFTRRACFFADFKHIHTITGQFYGPVGDCDRISVKNRKNTSEYLRNVLSIRTTRPAKPWTKLKDLSIIMLANKVDENLGLKIRNIWLYTFYPYQLHLSLPQVELNKLSTQMPVLVKHLAEGYCSNADKVDSLLNHCQGQYIAIVNSNYPVNETWIAKSVNALINSSNCLDVIELEHSTADNFSAVMPKSLLSRARQSYGNLDIVNSLKAVGANIRKAQQQEYCFGFDSHLAAAKDAQSKNDWIRAAQIYDIMKCQYGNDLWMDTMCAYSLFRAEYYSKALEIVSSVNDTRPTVSTMQLQGKILHKQKNYISAIEYLQAANNLIKGKASVWI